MRPSSTTRRGFLENISSIGAAAAGTLATLESARGYTANDTLNVGCLGTGGRCQTLDEVAGPDSRRPDRRRLRHLRRSPRCKPRSSPIRRPSPASIIARSSTARTSTPS